MKILLLILILPSVFFSFFIFAGTRGPIIVTGKVVEYDKDTVTLSQMVEQKVIVPRNLIPKQFKLETGKKVSAFFNPEEISEVYKKSSSGRKK